MEMSTIRHESHVAQQSRRDKLRVAQFSHHLENLQANVEQELNPPDVPQVRILKNGHLLYDPVPVLYSSEMLNYSSTRQVLLDPPPEQSVASEIPISMNSDTHNSNNWKVVSSQHGCDWGVVNYACGSANSNHSQVPIYAGDSLPNSMKVSNISSLYLTPGCSAYQNVNSSLASPTSEIQSLGSRRVHGDLEFSALQLYQNTLCDVVNLAQNGSKGLELPAADQKNDRETFRGGYWTDGVNGHAVVSQHADQSDALIYRVSGSCNQWNSDTGFLATSKSEEPRNVVRNSITQALSLSLSSNLHSETHAAQFAERDVPDVVQSTSNITNNPSDSKILSPGILCLIPKPSIGNKGYGNPLPDILGISNVAHRSTGPLGPFTGYATILKSSKYLKPAQQLLDEYCSISCPNIVKSDDVLGKVSGEMNSSADIVHAENEFDAKGGSSGVSTSTFYGSNEMSGEGGRGSSSWESHQPKYQQKEAKLLYMQEEVCRRYKQYHQQMHMVASSFESVAGLSTATPYISLALKTVSRHFRCLKTVISDQLRHIRKALGEDLACPTTGTSNDKGDTSTPQLKPIDQTFQRHKSGVRNMSILEPQQHIWRPQRGLPERAVAILRAWLFDHFLHPYPTDTDKHMLATQTGLSRNQVSNWFINARVRVWKPMVEEIHMLETKCLAERDVGSGKSEGKSLSEGLSRPIGDQRLNKLIVNQVADKQMEYIGTGTSTGMGNAQQWNQEKRSRVDSQIHSKLDGSLMSFMPHQHTPLEIGGLGAVSLTLGLRHASDSIQMQYPLQPEDPRQLRQYFGGDLVHDFA
ncbi:POX domain, partial [Dillenia turbinata]